MIRRIGYIVATLVAVVVFAVAGIYVASEMKAGSTVTAEIRPITIPADSVSLARGRQLARAIGKCADCHGEDLGGGTVIDDPAMGLVTAPNLTGGGIGANRSDAELAHALRHGVNPKGVKLMIMPSYEYAHFSEADLAALIAYVRSVPPVTRERPPIKLGPVARGLIAFGAMPVFDADRIDHSMQPPAAPAEGPTAEYGAYLARVGGCQGCHGEGFSGGKIPTGDPSWPPASNLTPSGIGHYSEADFTTLLRTGKRPGGTEVGSAMPTKWTREMTDLEIKAVWEFLRTVPPREFGNR